MKQITSFLLPLVLVLSISIVACSNKNAQTTPSQDKDKKVESKVVKDEKAAEKPTPTPKKDAIALISTELGDIKVKLYGDTPQHRDNFLKLAKEGFYDGTIFHRVIPNFMIQGGDPDSKGAAPTKRLGMGGPGYTIPAEFSKKYIHKKGALSAARKGDQVNPTKASSGSQFYVVQGKISNSAELDMIENRLNFSYTPEQREAYKTVGGTPFLDTQYTVFGEVLEGLEIIDKIAAVKTNKALGDRPVEDITMKVTVIEE